MIYEIRCYRKINWTVEYYTFAQSCPFHRAISSNLDNPLSYTSKSNDALVFMLRADQLYLSQAIAMYYVRE